MKDDVGYWLRKFYAQKTAGYGKTFEEYRDLFCESVGELEEDISNKEVHAFVQFPIRLGHEFRKIRIFGKDPLDEYTTIETYLLLY